MKLLLPKASDKVVKILVLDGNVAFIKTTPAANCRPKLGHAAEERREKEVEAIGLIANAIPRNHLSFGSFPPSPAWRARERVMFFHRSAKHLSVDAFAACENTDTMEWRAEQQ